MLNIIKGKHQAFVWAYSLIHLYACM